MSAHALRPASIPLHPDVTKSDAAYISAAVTDTDCEIHTNLTVTYAVWVLNWDKFGGDRCLVPGSVIFLPSAFRWKVEPIRAKFHLSTLQCRRTTREGGLCRSDGMRN